MNQHPWADEHRDLKLADGDERRFENVAPRALLRITPAGGAYVTVDYLPTPAGDPFAWPHGGIFAAASDETPGPLAAIIIRCTGGSALAELDGGCRTQPPALPQVQEDSVKTTVQLASADILALKDTPFVLVPAPGAGKMVVPLGIVYEYTYATGAYTVTHNPVVSYNGDTAAALNDGAKLAALLAETASKNALEEAFGKEPLPAVDNQALTLACATANPSAGGGSLKVTTIYQIVDL